MFFETGDPTGAARLLEPIVEAEPQNASVRQLLARAYFQSAQLGRAEEQLRVLVDRDPSDHYAHRPADSRPHPAGVSAHPAYRGDFRPPHRNPPHPAPAARKAPATPPSSPLQRRQTHQNRHIETEEKSKNP
jgi:hypothetical protein